MPPPPTEFRRGSLAISLVKNPEGLRGKEATSWVNEGAPSRFWSQFPRQTLWLSRRTMLSDILNKCPHETNLLQRISVGGFIQKSFIVRDFVSISRKKEILVLRDLKHDLFSKI